MFNLKWRLLIISQIMKFVIFKWEGGGAPFPHGKSMNALIVKKIN